MAVPERFPELEREMVMVYRTSYSPGLPPGAPPAGRTGWLDELVAGVVLRLEREMVTFGPLSQGYT